MTDPATIERLAREAGYDVDTDGITMPYYHPQGPADERAFLSRFADLVLAWWNTEGWKDEPIPRVGLNGSVIRDQALEDAAKIVDAAQPMGRISWTAAEIRAMKDKP